jgi:hypothetical protein
MYIAADPFACPAEPGHQLFDSFCPAFDFVVQSRDLGGCCPFAGREVKMCFPDPLGRQSNVDEHRADPAEGLFYCPIQQLLFRAKQNSLFWVKQPRVLETAE